MPLAKASGHYVNSIIAGYEARRNGYDEALLLEFTATWRGQRREFFIVRDGEVKTPPLNSVLPGITRAAVMKILRDASIEVSSRPPRDAVYIADEAFMTARAESPGARARRPHDRAASGPVTIKVQEFSAMRCMAATRYRDWLHYV